MKVLITGVSGFFGSKLFEKLVRKHEVIGTGFNKVSHNTPYLDITDSSSVMKFFDEAKPDIVIHAAAISNADFCEENPKEADKINIEGTRNVAEACKITGAKMIFLSSDYVFDGKKNESYEEDDSQNPVNYYGKTKAEGERIVSQTLNNFIIIRPTILYGFNVDSAKETFVEKVISSLESGKEFEADDTVKKYPLLIDDLADAVSIFIDKNENGVFNIGSEKQVTRFEWAKIIAEKLGLDSSLVKPVEGVNPATKPLNVYFSSEKAKRSGIFPVDVEKGMEIYKAQKGCMFRMIYSVKPDQMVLGSNASVFRIELGKRLVKEHPADADYVVGVPESGVFGATGFSAESRIPVFFSIIRDYYTRKTLFESNKGLRSELLRKKLIFVPELIKGKKIVVVDEAIISGTTLKFVVEKLKELGAKEIHVRIPSPPMRFSCPYRIIDSNAELPATEFKDEKNYQEYKNKFEEKLMKEMDVDSLNFISIEGFTESIKTKNPCIYCFE